MALLEMITGKNPGQIIQLTNERAIIGRHPTCAVVIDQSEASRNHAEITLVHGSYFIEDLRSVNQTYLNGVAIRARVQLRENDRIRICGSEFCFRMSNPNCVAASLLMSLKQQSINFRGPSWQAVQSQLLDKESTLLRSLLDEFARVVILDSEDGSAESGFDMDLFLVRSWTRIVAELGLPNDSQVFHPQQIAETLKSEEPALFCILNVHRFDEEQLHQLRGLGFTQEAHHFLYVGQNSALQTVSFPLTEPDGTIVHESLEFEGVSIISSSSISLASKNQSQRRISITLTDISTESRMKNVLDLPVRFTHAAGEAGIGAIVLEVIRQVIPEADEAFIFLRATEGSFRLLGSLNSTNQLPPIARIEHCITLNQSRLDGYFAMHAPLRSLSGQVIGMLWLSTAVDSAFDDTLLSLLTSIAAQAGMALHGCNLAEQLVHWSSVDRELEFARSTQASLLPKSSPTIAGYEVADFYQPAGHVGGDYYEYIVTTEGKIVLVLGDVAGRGVPASIMAAFLASAIRHHVNATTKITAAMSAINTELLRLGGNRFVTLVLAELDTHRHHLTLVNAGHLPPMIRRQGGEIEEMPADCAGMPLAVMDSCEYEPFSTTLAPGDALLLYTDGIAEAFNLHNDIYGLQRIKDVLTGSSGSTMLVKELIEDVNRFSESRGLSDDICVIACQRL